MKSAGNIDTPLEIGSVPTVFARDVRVDDTTLWVTLTDGRVISSPLTNYPILARATPEQRARWKIMPPGDAIRWEEIDEDVSVNVLLGLPS